MLVSRFVFVIYQWSVKSVSVLMFNYFLFCCLVLIFLLVSVKASATTYYVGNDGSDSSSAAQAQIYSTPWATIQKAADNVNAGDTVIVKDGTYTDTDADRFTVHIKIGGSSGSPVTFKSENKWGALVDGENSAYYGFYMSLASVDYVNIEDFEISNLRSDGIFIQTSGQTPGCEYINVTGNHVHDLTGITNRFGASGISTGLDGDNIVIDSNLIHDFDGHGIYAKAPNTSVTNNVIYNPKDDVGWSKASFCLQTRAEAENLVIANNTFVGAAQGTAGAIVIYQDCPNVVVENNIFYDGAGGYGIRVFGHDAGAVTIRNNLSNGGTLMNYHSNSDSSLFTLSNNITYTDSNNITNTDPLFKDEVNNDYTIIAGSPAIDKGFASDITDHDYAGNPRPVDGNGDGVKVPDIGAYEWFSDVGVAAPQSFGLVGIGN